MSLRPDDRSSRRRDRSSTRDRSRSRSNVRVPSPPSAVSSSYGYQPPTQSSATSQIPGSFSNGSGQANYEIRAPGEKPRGSISGYQARSSDSSVPYPPDGFTMGGYTDFPPHERPGYVAPRHSRKDDDDTDSDSDSDDRSLAYDNRPLAKSSHLSRQDSYGSHHPAQGDYQSNLPNSAQYNYTPQSTSGSHSSQYGPSSYQSQPAYQYAQTPEKITYTSKPQKSQQAPTYTQDPKSQRRQDLPRNYGDEVRDTRRSDRQYSEDNRDQYRPDVQRKHSQPSSYGQEARIVDITPDTLDFDHDRRRDRAPSTSKSSLLSVGGAPSGFQAPPSPGLGPRMSRLSVSGNRPDGHSIGGGLPPPSPLLEAYHGTYQSISPMPTAMRLDNDDIDDLTPLDYATPHTKHGKDHEKDKKRVKLYDPEADARALASALSSHKVDADVICDILPPLTDDQIWELRKEYKKQVKIQGKGINLSKHLKMKLSGNFGKIVYVTALGRWESEGYWANFFYQSHASRRELVIESLMGRTNAEIRSIKDEFKDKRYNDDLVKCMEKELKMDKFRTAVLMALEGRRQEEQDVYPQEYRDRDVEMLHRSVTARQGGESAMLEVVIRRSDAHLREILRQYERMYGDNFARVALKKSNNLVGEVIAHMLNGVINKPARDALLLRHAIKDVAAHNKDDDLRYELLTSRLVRLHWDRLHLLRVKKEYKEKYGKHLEEDLEDSTKGDLREFVCELCRVQGPK